MEHLLGWNWDAQWDSHEHPGSCTAIRSLGCLWSNGWVRASNGRHLPTGALPWEWMASALQGWVFSLVLEALGSVLLCEVKCMGPGCSLQLGLRSMLRQLLGQMSLHPERGIVHEWNWGFCSFFICSSKFSKQPMGLVPYAQDLKTRMASLWLNLFMTKSGCHLWALPFPLSSILRAQFPTQSLFFPTYVITWDLSKSLDYKIPSANFTLHFSEKYSTCRWISVVFIGNSELHILLLCHLDLSQNTFHARSNNCLNWVCKQ